MSCGLRGRGSSLSRAASTRPTASWPRPPSTRLPVSSGLEVDASRTEAVPLIGAESLEAARAEVTGRGPRQGHLGTPARHATARSPGEVLDGDGGTIRSSAPILPGAAPLQSQPRALYAVTHEGARLLDDVLSRRTRISFEAADRGRAAAPVARGSSPGRSGWSPPDARGGGLLQQTHRCRACCPAGKGGRRRRPECVRAVLEAAKGCRPGGTSHARGSARRGPDEALRDRAPERSSVPGVTAEFAGTLAPLVRRLTDHLRRGD